MDHKTTLRDEFAKAALTGLSQTIPSFFDKDDLPQFIAETCYQLADAMIAQRAVKNNPPNKSAQ